MFDRYSYQTWPVKQHKTCETDPEPSVFDTKNQQRGHMLVCPKVHFWGRKVHSKIIFLKGFA